MTAFTTSAVVASMVDLTSQHEFRMGVLAARQQTNLQSFSSALGGAGAPAIINSGDPDRPFEVDGDTFPDYETAANRACDNQKNACAQIANNGTGQFAVGDCDRQSEQCKSTASSAAVKAFAAPASVFVSSDDQFDFFCDSSENVFPKVDTSNPSSASTADGEASPEIPPLPAPRLPERVRGLLRTPPTGGSTRREEGDLRYGTSDWGSPYPESLRDQSTGSDTSEGSPLPIHLQLQTPFLRPVPLVEEPEPEPRPSGLSAAAAVLANRARRIAHGITEDWIRQHTAGGSEQEKRHWFSDGTGDSENSSLSGSFSGDEAAWLGYDDISTTPRPKKKKDADRRYLTSGRDRKKQASNETLRQAHIDREKDAKMASSDERATPDSVSDRAFATDSTRVPQELSFVPERPGTPKMNDGLNGSASISQGQHNNNKLSTPPRIIVPKRPLNATPRLKKKLPWKGKNIMVLLPANDRRGQKGGPPMPLTAQQVEGMLRDYQELGYTVDGFDLSHQTSDSNQLEQSQSRGSWPDFDDVARERQQRGWKVLLPDLNAWNKHVDELNEAKLRALGVSFGDDEPPLPPLPAISPAASSMSRQASLPYPQLPFSPPIPTSSASSNQANGGFPFHPPPFVTSGTQSPGIPAGISPGPFGKMHNPRASISIPSPHWPHQGMLGHRVGSPSLANLGAIMSPTSPFSPDGMGPMNHHQRHMSLQFPVLPHQFQPPVRASPRLQDLCEVEEEPLEDETPQKPEPGFVRHNASDSLQHEIDEAEYHLEEQMRSQLENDQDYSPHNENDKMDMAPIPTVLPPHHHHMGEPTVQFAAQLPRFGGGADGIPLHHPRPHSRGHSLSQKYYTEEDIDGGFKPNLLSIKAHSSEGSEIETNPSNLGTPMQGFEFGQLSHQRSCSGQSNPWNMEDPERPMPGGHQGHISHGSKSSISKLNVEAPEFKFNPGSTFTPSGGFAFGGNSFQPTPAFNVGLNQAPTSFGLPPAGPSKINVNAPAFAPGQTDFSFSSSGPKFRPDAPAFTPSSVQGSVSGTERTSHKAGSIFGSIDLSGTDIVKPAKSKAIPIIPPVSETSRPNGGREAPDQSADESRYKRARSAAHDDDATPVFAQAKDDTSLAPAIPEAPAEDDAVPVEEKSFDESNLGHEDNTQASSMIISATPDTEATISPSEASHKGGTVPWAPFEFNNDADMRAFSEARSFGSEKFQPGHKKSLSATAKAFVPGVSVFTGEMEDTVTVEDSVSPVREEPAKPTEEDVVESMEETEEKPTPPTPIAAPVLDKPLPPPPTGLAASRYAQTSSPPPPPPKQTGLSASRFASVSSPVQDKKLQEELSAVSPLKHGDLQPEVHLSAENLSPVSDEEHIEDAPAEPSMADLDEIMRRLRENPSMGVIKTYHNPPQWKHASPTLHIPAADPADPPPLHLPPHGHSRSEAPSPGLSDQAGLEDPFVDQLPLADRGSVQHVNGTASLASDDWDRSFSDDEHAKLESRANFFDGHVNDVVGGLLATRLGPVEEALEAIRNALSAKGLLGRQDRRSMSVDIRESDADDEDEEPVLRRSMSPRRDRKLEQIRSAVLDAFAVHQRTQPAEPSLAKASDSSGVLNAIEQMRTQLSQSLQPALRGDIQTIVEEVVEKHVPVIQRSTSATGTDEKVNELQARIAALEQRLQEGEVKLAAETTARRVAEDRAAEASRELENAATKIEVELMTRSAQTQRINDLEERVHHADHQVEDAVKSRRAAEDRLSEVQRLLRISSEEESRLRDLAEEKEAKIKAAEAAQSKSAMRLALLEASQSNSDQSQSEAQNRFNSLEAELRKVRDECQYFRSEADRVTAIAKTRDAEIAQAMGENKALHKLIDTLGTQLQENERLRDTYRSRFASLQEDMARAAQEIAEENARRAKKEQSLLARQEVLEARLQAEARTRERIETELERLEMGERQGMRAVAECKRLEGILAEMRTENGQLHQNLLRSQAEFQEARESGAREVQRTREAMQTEIESANHQVNVVREELEDQVLRLRSQLDQVKMDADTSKVRLEMLLEEAVNSKKTSLDELAQKHQNEIEDLQARYERQLSNTTEDAHRAEANLLERLSISTSKSEHLQDKVAHLEDKLQVAQEAARAAAQAAKSSVSTASSELLSPAVAGMPREPQLPEKISPQALRESIMVLQEQLQEREQRLEELEQQLSKVDPEAETKISKRDDEILWLRELLAVRHSDLQDIIAALGRDDYDKTAVKDAAIRLKANLQMEEQERERAMNGGSAITLPNIAATIREAATPRVAQAVGPLAAAWGNWRKGRESSFGNLSGVLSSPAPASGSSSTPSRSSPAASSFLGGLLTPPTSHVRQTPSVPQVKQPTAFGSTGRRFTPQDHANWPLGPASAVAPMPTMEAVTPSTPPRQPTILAGPVTPPMRSSAYDSDAQDFDDAEFFDE
ncbi:hypothetical protein QBC35DRAFT_554093 [Podospora australis]|uniref:Core-binding (CB) domain-containing protein n=1 Tax=Podospora australis TaxID=1536484 RepID=A0AAN6WQV1_9PEZI|nr:hypothetical protein QBC35DRAFT_554093 [Podospora australis]